MNKRSTGIDLRVYSGGVKVRTRESGGGLSKGGKGGLLHSQLMELCQLLGGGRRISTPNRLPCNKGILRGPLQTLVRH